MTMAVVPGTLPATIVARLGDSPLRAIPGKGGMPVGLLVTTLLFLLSVFPLPAELTRVVIHERGNVLGGKTFGTHGSYEFLRGEVVFGLDPESADGDAVPDLKLAERNSDGKVSFRADFELLRPKDPAKASGVLLYDVVNRGQKTVLGIFNHGSGSASPQDAAYYGDGFLLEQGYAVLWSGWQYDVVPDNGHFGLQAPILHQAGAAISGVVRAEFIPSELATSFSVGHRGHQPIPIWKDSCGPQKLLSDEQRADSTGSLRLCDPGRSCLPCTFPRPWFAAFALFSECWLPWLTSCSWPREREVRWQPRICSFENSWLFFRSVRRGLGAPPIQPDA